MRKSELVTHVAARAFVSKATADAMVSAVFSTIGEALARDETVVITAFGTFTTRAPRNAPGSHRCCSVRSRARRTPRTSHRPSSDRLTSPSTSGRSSSDGHSTCTATYALSFRLASSCNQASILPGSPKGFNGIRPWARQPMFLRSSSIAEDELTNSFGIDRTHFAPDLTHRIPMRDRPSSDGRKGHWTRHPQHDPLRSSQPQRAHVRASRHRAASQAPALNSGEAVCDDVNHTRR